MILLVWTGNVQFGTLGGILTDGNIDYGLSCAHVLNNIIGSDVDQPSYHDSSTYNKVGNIELLAMPIKMDSQSICNPYSHSNSINILDTALFEIDSSQSTINNILKHNPGLNLLNIPAPGCV